MKIIRKGKNSSEIISRIKPYCSKIFGFLIRNHLLLILFLGFAVQLINIDTPALGIHAWRQSDTATIAREYYRHGFNFFLPEVNSNGTEPEYIASEFPILPFSWALIYKFTGESLIIGRLSGIIFTLISAFLIYRLTNIFFSKNAAMLSTLIFLFAPLTIIMGKTIQPEPAMLCFSIGAIYLFVKWCDGDNQGYFISAIICSALAFLIKIPTVYILLPILWVFFIKFGKNFIKKPQFYVFIILSVLPAILWYTYAKNLSLISGLSFAGFGWNPFSMLSYDLVHIMDPASWSVFLSRLQEFIIPFLLPIFIIGFFSKMKFKQAYLFHFWMIGIILYTFLLLDLSLAHEYYQIPFLPVLSIFIGITLSRFWSDDLFKIGIIVLITVFIGYSLNYSISAGNIDLDNTYLKIGQEIDKNLPGNATIIIGSQMGEPTLGFYANRSSFIRVFNQITPNEIEYLISRGAKYFVTAESFDSNPDLSNYMVDTYPINSQNDYVLFNLTQNQ